MNKFKILNLSYAIGLVIIITIIYSSYYERHMKDKETIELLKNELHYNWQEINCYYSKAFSVGFDRGFYAAKDCPNDDYQTLKELDEIVIIKNFKCITK